MICQARGGALLPARVGLEVELYITSEGQARGGAILPVRVGLEVELYYQ